MRRRGSLALLGVAAMAGSRALRAQTTALPVIGFHSGRSAAEATDLVVAFRRVLKEAGCDEGRHLTIEYLWADGDYARLPDLASDLVRRKVALLVATGGPRAVLAARAASTTIPIVFAMGGDPVALGVVTSLARPGGNATGVSFLTFELTAKRMELLSSVTPRSAVLAFIVNPNTPTAEAQAKSAMDAGRSFAHPVQVMKAGTAAEIDAAFATFAQLRPAGVLIGTDAFLAGRSKQFIVSAAQYAVPAIYEGREAVLAGGLISYGPGLSDVYAHVGRYTGKILSGARASELPVVQPTKFEFVINGKTAQTLGLRIPQALLLRADEVIE